MYGPGSDNKNGLYGTAYTCQNNQRASYTQYNLSNWIKNYVKKNNLKILDKHLREALKGEINNDLFNSLNWSCGNCNIYKKEMFISKNWKNFNREFNSIAGGYRY